MNTNKYNLICVRHLKDQNVLKSYGLDGPLVEDQEHLIDLSATKIKKEAEKLGFKKIRILYTDRTIRIDRTAHMLFEKLKMVNLDVTLFVDSRLDVFEQGEVLLPKNYKDGEHFDPLMHAWDVVCDEAYIYRNIDYRFGSGLGYKTYPILARSFLKSGESFADLLLRKYSLIENFLNHTLHEEDELLVMCTQSDLPLLLMEFEELAKDDSIRPENLPFDCWDVYKKRIQGKYNGDIPMGYTVSFDLMPLIQTGFFETIKQARQYLENRKTVSPSSIQGIINATSNDFSSIDSEFKNEIGLNIDSAETIDREVGFYPISVVIPYYNSRSTIFDVLLSIELQNLTKKELSKVEVIVVNDGWNDDLEIAISPDEYSFNLKVITCKENGGRSAARNIGARVAKHDILMFLDADNLVSGECLREHSIRNQIAPNHLYTSLVANIVLEEMKKMTKPYFSVDKPLPKPEYFNEFRVSEIIKSNSVGIYDITKDIQIEILKETNNFRDYGYGRTVAYYDLPSMYATYCVSVTKEMFKKIGGFSEKFKGWGMEDSYFGAVGIIRGAKIIPILSCGSYSVNLPSHSGSEEKEKIELKKNIDRYKELMLDTVD